nr:glycosyltransferase [Vibrio sinus]
MEALEAKATPTIAFVGWLEIEKGVRELLQACEKLAKFGLSFTCLLAGDGTQKQWALDFIERHGLNGKVKLQGWLGDNELLEHYRCADIFVLPSWKEGMPNSLIEAMSSGLCPVVTSVGIIPDFVRDYEHGLLVEPRSAESLYEALKALIETPELQVECARAAHKLAQEFEKNRVIPRLCDIMEKRLSS